LTIHLFNVFQIIFGTLDKIEIWNPEVYEEYEKGQPDYETVAAKVLGSR